MKDDGHSSEIFKVEATTAIMEALKERIADMEKDVAELNKLRPALESLTATVTQLAALQPHWAPDQVIQGGGEKEKTAGAEALAKE